MKESIRDVSRENCCKVLFSLPNDGSDRLVAKVALEDAFSNIKYSGFKSVMLGIEKI